MAKTLNFIKIDVTVTTAGTAVPILASGANRYVKSFTVYNPSSSDNIYVGSSDVDDTWIPTGPGVIQSKFSDLDTYDEGFAFDLTKIYIDADNNGNTAVVVAEVLVNSND